MPSQLQTEVIEAASNGFDSESAPLYIAKGRGTLVQDMLVGRDGKLSMRGPMRGTAIPFANSQPATGFWAFDDKVLIRRVAGSGPSMATYDAAAFGGTVSSITTTPLAAASTKTLTTSHCRVGDFVYGVANGGTVKLTHAGQKTTYAADSSIYQWDGALGLKVVTSAPVGVRDVANHLNRLWALGGSVAGTTTPVFADRLYWSDDGGPTALTTAAWQDDASGLTNQIVLDGSPTDYGVGLARLGANLLILRRRSLFLLTGSSPDSFAVRRVASVGCIDPGSILEYDDGVFFLSDEGFCFFDGSTVKVVSRSISAELRIASWTSLTSVARVGAEYLILATGGLDTQTFQDPKSWLYHAPTQSWSKLTAPLSLLQGKGLLTVFNTANQAVGYDGDLLWELGFVALPDVTQPSVAGLDWNTSTLSGTSIIPIYRSRLFKLSSPAERAQLHRAMFDARLQVYSSGDPSHWSVTILDAVGNEIAAFPQAISASSGDSEELALSVRRAVYDVLGEADEVMIEWRLVPSGVVAITLAEILDSRVEYQTTRQRTG